MERFAGDNKIMQQMAVNLENERQRNKQFIAELQQKQAEQTKRDIAAVYGEIIPFA